MSLKWKIFNGIAEKIGGGQINKFSIVVTVFIYAIFFSFVGPMLTGLLTLMGLPRTVVLILLLPVLYFAMAAMQAMYEVFYKNMFEKIKKGASEGKFLGMSMAAWYAYSLKEDEDRENMRQFQKTLEQNEKANISNRRKRY